MTKTATIKRLNDGSWGVYYSDQKATPGCIRVPDSRYAPEATKKHVVMDTAKRGYLPIVEQ
ncbi:MAG: hypothetical protein EOM26_14070 [Alphaproteobacteria bacterium]|nr:hypothetical protein [Alphaproteobacteria bacterium]